MNHNQAEKYLLSLTDYEKSPGIIYSAANYDLRRVKALLNKLGNPQEGRKTIHIAGTKGKGSTAAMISSVLSSAGYRTGLFTSPHLISWQERISINGSPISKNSFAQLVTSIQPHVHAINEEGRFGNLTTFEVLTAMAFLYFYEKRTDFQVIETGMGGRLDATNIVDADVCIITSISFDHTQVLGDTLAQIAGEKAGIIKPGCVVVSAPQSPESTAVIEAKCISLNVTLIQAGKDITWKRLGGDLKGQNILVTGKLRNYDLNIPLLGDFQMENVSLSIAAIETLQLKGVKIKYTDILRGLNKVKWPARMQILSPSPLIIIDGAHNSYSLKRVIESIRKYFSYAKVFVIFGSSQDKDIAGMAGELAGFADHIILTRSSHPRSARTDYLKAIFDQAGLKTDICQDAIESLSSARCMAVNNNLILATGSLFIASDIQRAFNKSDKISTPPPITDSRCRKITGLRLHL